MFHSIIPCQPMTAAEFDYAFPIAAAKLQRIIEREGDLDGARLEPEYLAALIREIVIAYRMEKQSIDRLLAKTKGRTANGTTPNNSIIPFPAHPVKEEFAYA